LRDTFVISRLDHLRALADPIRLRVVDALTEREGTVGTLAQELGEPPSRLYPHVDLLLETGLIEVARRIPRRGAEQRMLRAVARDYVLDRTIFGASKQRQLSIETMVEVARSMLAGATDDLTEGVRSGSLDPAKPGRNFLIEGKTVLLYPEAFASLSAEVAAALNRAEARGGTGRKARYRFVVTAYPADLAERPGSLQPVRSKAASRSRIRAARPHLKESR
jgi:DNA-binding transcriptional ArsR family regulator